jgi:hypothetical protein
VDQEDKRRFVERAQRALRKHKRLEDIKRQKLESQRRKGERAQAEEAALDRAVGRGGRSIRSSVSARRSRSRHARRRASGTWETSASDTRLEEALVIARRRVERASRSATRS